MNKRLRKRKNSLRLQGYDYTQSGAYFVTILTYKRLHLFGDIVAGEMRLSSLGRIVDSCWLKIPSHFSSVELDVYVIMPNHMHGIILLDNQVQKVTLGRVMNNFKGAVTRTARRSALDIDLEHPVWHRNYHDHIIRNKPEYDFIANYVIYNPAKWEEDRYHG